MNKLVMEWQARDSPLSEWETRKSNLLLEAALLQAQDRGEAADGKFAEAAEIEERLGVACRERGFLEKAQMHQFSAASCWAQAGDFYHALTLCRELLTDSAVSHRLQLRVQEFADTLRARRAVIQSGVNLATV